MHGFLPPARSYLKGVAHVSKRRFMTAAALEQSRLSWCSDDGPKGTDVNMSSRSFFLAGR